MDYVVQEALDNTVVLAESCTAEFPAKNEMPMFAPDKGRPYAVERLVAVCESNWERKTKGKSHTTQEYLERFQYEMDMLIDKDLS